MAGRAARLVTMPPIGGEVDDSASQPPTLPPRSAAWSAAHPLLEECGRAWQQAALFGMEGLFVLLLLLFRSYTSPASYIQ